MSDDFAVSALYERLAALRGQQADVASRREHAEIAVRKCDGDDEWLDASIASILHALGLLEGVE